MGCTHIINEIARRHGVSPEEVRAEMECAIGEGFRSQDARAREAWGEIAPDGVQPTPEELIFRLARAIAAAKEKYGVEQGILSG